MSETFDEMPEAIAAKIVWRLLSKTGQTGEWTFAEFERFLAQGLTRIDGAWRAAVAEIADAMREYAERKYQALEEHCKHLWEHIEKYEEWQAQDTLKDYGVR